MGQDTFFFLRFHWERLLRQILWGFWKNVGDATVHGSGVEKRCFSKYHLSSGRPSDTAKHNDTIEAGSDRPMSSKCDVLLQTLVHIL